MSKNLYQRIVAIMDDMGAVGKGGKTDYGDKYAYHKIDDIDDRLRQALVAHGVVVTVCDITNSRLDHYDGTDKYGKPRTTWYAECTLTILLVNVDNPEERETIMGWGQGLDYSDKATGKAISYAAKAAYLSAFHLRGQPDSESDDIRRPAPPAPPPVSEKDVADLTAAIVEANDLATIENTILRGSIYQRLKTSGPEADYENVSKLAKARHAVLKGQTDADS